jgi:hypothetical protein
LLIGVIHKIFQGIPAFVGSVAIALGMTGFAFVRMAQQSGRIHADRETIPSALGQ